jgi:alkylation response protein AidB-like acyl-CoA dehydrogenase
LVVRSDFDVPSLDESGRAAFRALVEEGVGPHIAEGEAHALVPAAVLSFLRAHGCFGRTIPVAHGGLGASLTSYAIQQEELARVWATAAVATTWTNLSGLLLDRFGSDEQRQLLPAMAQGDTLGAVAWTEPHGGTDAAALRTSAVQVDGGWVLNGAKRLIDNVGGAGLFVIGARTDTTSPPYTMFLVRPTDAGFVAGGVYATVGLRAAGVGWFTLEDCFVSDDRVVGRVGDGLRQMMSMVEFGRTGVAAICLGMATGALDATREFLRDRRSFGRPLSENDVVLARMGDLRARLAAGRLLTYHVASLVDAGVRCDVEAAMAKLFVSELALEVTDAAMHLHGGIGFTDQLPLERHFRDSRAFTIGEGTSEILRFIIGRDDFRRVS